jgi:hypothetical protein
MRPALREKRLRAVCAVLAAAACAGQGLVAQQTLRTPEGHPDLQGLWLNDTATPLERLKEWTGKATLSDGEAREYERRYQLDRTAAASHVDPVFELQAAGDLDTYEPGHLLPGNRMSLIVDPPDGRVPALTTEGQRRAAAQAARMKNHYGDNPEDFVNGERCLQMVSTTPIMLPVYYNNNVQIVQTPDYVMVQTEMIHDARIVPLDGRAHLPAAISQWKGNSVGRWENDALVVDTTNFGDGTSLRGSGPALHVVERFSLKDPDTLVYAFTIDDPATFVRTWSGESQMRRSDGRMFEYACHEGNESLPMMMRGYRFFERESSQR